MSVIGSACSEARKAIERDLERGDEAVLGFRPGGGIGFGEPRERVRQALGGGGARAVRRRAEPCMAMVRLRNPSRR